MTAEEVREAVAREDWATVSCHIDEVLARNDESRARRGLPSLVPEPEFEPDPF